MGENRGAFCSKENWLQERFPIMEAIEKIEQQGFAGCVRTEILRNHLANPTNKMSRPEGPAIQPIYAHYPFHIQLPKKVTKFICRGPEDIS
jgi:hypothetical protein